MENLLLSFLPRELQEELGRFFRHTEIQLILDISASSLLATSEVDYAVHVDNGYFQLKLLSEPHVDMDTDADCEIQGKGGKVFKMPSLTIDDDVWFALSTDQPRPTRFFFAILALTRMVAKYKNIITAPSGPICDENHEDLYPLIMRIFYETIKPVFDAAENVWRRIIIRDGFDPTTPLPPLLPLPTFVPDGSLRTLDLGFMRVSYEPRPTAPTTIVSWPG